MQFIVLLRLGAALALFAPFATFSVRYVLATGTTAGLLESIVVGMVFSVVETVNLAIANPVQTAIYITAGWLLWRFAFSG